MTRRSYLDDEVESTRRPSRRALLLGGLGAPAALCGTIAAGYGAFRFGLLDGPPEIDRVTACRLDLPSNHTTLVLVDTTDPLTPTHLHRLRSGLIVNAG